MNGIALAAAVRLCRDDFWPTAAREFVGSLAAGGHHPGGLLTVGSAEHEPWHLTAHLREQAEMHAMPTLVPTLVRRATRAGAPQHLRIGLDRLATAGRGSTILVVSPVLADEQLLERVHDARRHGATLLVLTTQDEELTGLAHDALVTGPVDTADSASFDLVSHLVGYSLSLPGRSASRLRRMPVRWRRAA